MNRSVGVGLGLVALLGAFVFFLLTVGSLGGLQPELQRLSVEQVLEHPSPADRFGDRELRVSGWYAELDADCEPRGEGPPGGPSWLTDPCPLRVLMPYQPSESVSQAELEASGLRLSAPTGAAFPSRARPEGPNLRLQQLVFVGHFDDPAAADCPEAVRERCRSTFVVDDYDGLLR